MAVVGIIALISGIIALAGVLLFLAVFTICLFSVLFYNELPDDKYFAIAGLLIIPAGVICLICSMIMRIQGVC